MHRISRRIPTGAVLTALGVALAGCHDSEADLGASVNYQPIFNTKAPPVREAWPIRSSNTLWKLVDGEQPIMRFTVGSTQSYWIRSLRPNEYNVPPTSSVSWCKTQSCRGTFHESTDIGHECLLTSSYQTVIGAPLRETGGSLYFGCFKEWHVVTDAQIETTQSQIAPLVWSEKAAKASELLPEESNREQSAKTVMGQVTGLDVLTVSNQTLVLSGKEKLYVCDASDCDGRLRALPGTFESLFYRTGPGVWAGDNAWSYELGPELTVAADSDFVYLVISNEIVRVRLDGSAEREVVVPDLRFVGSIAVDEGNVYWTEDKALGSVKSCPKAGCNGEPRTIMNGLRHPGSLAISDGHLYVMEPCDVDASVTENTDRILGCSLSNCESPTVLTEGVGANSYVTVANGNVFFSGSHSCGRKRQGDFAVPDYYIAALPKLKD